MRNTRRAAALVVLSVAMMAGPASAHDEHVAEADQREAAFVLHVVNYAALSREVLAGARARAAKVYEVIGVRIVWVDGEETFNHRRDGRIHLIVMLLSHDMAKKKIAADGIKDGVLGQAHIPSGRGYIFCDRIAAMPGAPAYFPTPLGDVIAHEVGHLVLSTNGHSRSGIMRTNIDLHTMHLQSFDGIQARTIRTTLLTRPQLQERR